MDISTQQTQGSSMSKLAGDLIKERRKRKGWSQTVLGDFVGMSAATIHRIEHGEKIPTDQEANLIAGFLGIENDVMEDACQTARERQPTIPKSAYKTEWQTAHPATYSGPVWIQVTPQAETHHEQHTFTLRWGVWERKGSFTLENGQDKIFLAHYKHHDGLGMPLYLTLSHPCYVVFGRDDIEAEMIDINFQWRRVEPPDPEQIWLFTKYYFIWFWKKLSGKK